MGIITRPHHVQQKQVHFQEENQELGQTKCRCDTVGLYATHDIPVNTNNAKWLYLMEINK